MQFRTNRYISSKESVILGARKILEKYRETYDYNEIVRDYNGGEWYSETISDIISILFPHYSTDTFSIENDSYDEDGFSKKNKTLIDARNKAGLTQKELSVVLNIPKKEISEIERGITECPAWVEQLIIEKIEAYLEEDI